MTDTRRHNRTRKVRPSVASAIELARRLSNESPALEVLNGNPSTLTQDEQDALWDAVGDVQEAWYLADLEELREAA